MVVTKGFLRFKNFYYKIIFVLFFLFLYSFATVNGQQLSITKTDNGYSVACKVNGKEMLQSPADGLWSIATGWLNDWPTKWVHANPTKLTENGPWKILEGKITLPQGEWTLRDSYRQEEGRIHCIRRFEYKGKSPLKQVTLSVRWQVGFKNSQTFLPGILYYGNPSGEKNGKGKVPVYHGNMGEMAIFEEHRFAMPFVCLEGSDENKYFGVALHSIPSKPIGALKNDQWWSMGVESKKDCDELELLSGPTAYNDQKSVVKALQKGAMKYPDTYLTIQPETIIEKEFYIEAYPTNGQGTAFQQAVHSSLNIFKPFYSEDMPSFDNIIKSKYLYAQSRWIEGNGYAGYNMYPSNVDKKIVMGWCGQAEALGYALQRLTDKIDDPLLIAKIQKSLDHLSTSPVDANGFPVIYDIQSKQWSNQDHVSQGQAMYSFAKAIDAARKNKKLSTLKWEAFFKKACDAHVARILKKEWVPVSTNEAFYIAPLALASKLFVNPLYSKAALKAADYYAQRHLTMEEPYWGGTLDATCEDKEGAWAAFQGFLAVYDLTLNKKYLDDAKHACDVVLSYVSDWNIEMPAGRLADHHFKSSGWTVVSPQNQHLDVYGVVMAPSVYRMGLLLKDEDLKKVGVLMFRSCGQLIDAYGSQGEQVHHTNFAQSGNMTDVSKLRGGYNESWTVFWITAHFLNAAAQFKELGVTN